MEIKSPNLLTNYSSLLNCPSRKLENSIHPDQVDFLCETLYRWRDGARLVSFFSKYSNLFSGPRSSNYMRSSSVLIAYLYALYYSKKFDDFFRVMSESRFDPRYHNELMELWYEGRYAEDQQRKHKSLGPVDKYRIRKKFPPPSSVWDGDERIYSFKVPARKKLIAFYKENKYPTAEEKRELQEKTGLNIGQISNWFKNRRQRDKPEGREKF